MSRLITVLAVVALMHSTVLRAEGKGPGMAIHGDIEGGFAQSWQSTPATGTASSENQFLVDNLSLKMIFNLSDKTSVMLHNAFAVHGGNTPFAPASAAAGTGATPVGGYTTAPGYGGALNTSSYYSGATSHVGRLYFSNLGAYLQHRCSDDWTMTVGHFRVPFGMETMHERFGMASYHYSDTFNVMHGYEWQYDVGAKASMTHLGPGTFELSLTDGRATDDYYPATAARYHWETKAGAATLTPVASVYAGRFRGGPGDIGFSAGLNAKSGNWSNNLEWLYTSRTLTYADDSRTNDWSLYLEPTYSLSDGWGDVSAKAEYSSNKAGTAAAITDMNIGVGWTKQYSDGLRLRLAYAHRGLKGDRTNHTNHTNDFRILLGTQW